MERRGEHRHITRDSVQILVDGMALRCEMRNLSTSGCLIECPKLLPDIGVGIEVTLLPGYVVQGEVAWQVGESIGIFFIHPIRYSIVQHFALDDWALRSDWSANTVRVEAKNGT